MLLTFNVQAMENVLKMVVFVIHFGKALLVTDIRERTVWVLCWIIFLLKIVNVSIRLLVVTVVMLSSVQVIVVIMVHAINKVTVNVITIIMELIVV